jgi:Alpha/beta hydrolase
VTRPTVTQALAWRPAALDHLADGWDAAARTVHARVSEVGSEAADWSGSAANAACERMQTIVRSADEVARALMTAAVAARVGCDRIEAARTDLSTRVASAVAEGFDVADDGSVAPIDGDHVMRAAVLARAIGDALDRLGDADADTARNIDEPFAAGDTAAVVAGWPTMTGEQIARQIAAMAPEQRAQLVDEAPSIVGNTDGVPWDMRAAANRVNIAQAIVNETGTDPNAKRRIAFYQGLLGDVDGPAGGAPVDRRILAFDPARSTLIELDGNLDTAKSVAVLIPGMNTTLEGSAANTTTARRFVSATHGEVAAITYLGGPFPAADNLVAALAEAADPRFALDMAPRLAAFSADVDHTVDATGRQVPVTYIGHSYGGAILGTAEALGLTADRTLYVAAAGAGFGIDDPGDWHNRNPDVLRFSMTAPGDPIELVQGLPGGPHGADPDEMPGVIRLATGHYDDGKPMAGPRAHTAVIDCPASDSWRTILAVITGDREHIQVR